MFLLQYFFKLSVSLAMIYLFYHFILRRLTFYHHNRWYLSVYSLLCFFIAFININPVLEKNQLLDNKIVKAFPNMQDLTPAANNEAISAADGWSVWNWMMTIFLLGFVVLVVRLLAQYISFRRIKKEAELLSNGSPKLYQVNKTIIPFSFGNSIFINQAQHDEQELKEIIRHEFVHVRQKHTIDIIWSELLCALNWYNPFAWLLRKAIRQNLEFIADNNVLQSGMDKKQYQYLLLKVIGISQFSIANQFNFSSLKKRIAMMNKIKTARVQLLKSLFVLPVIAMLLLAFRGQMHDRTPLKTNVSDSLPFKTVLDRYADVSLHRSDAMDQTHKDFFERNKDVQLLHWKNDGSLQIYLTRDRVEKYLPGEFKNAEAKYGKLPAAAEGSHGRPVTIIDTVPQQTVPNAKGYFIDIKGIDGRCTVVVKDKDKKVVETIDMLKWNENQEKYESLYGEIPPVPSVAVIATVSNSELVQPVDVVGVPVTTSVTVAQCIIPSKVSNVSSPTEVRVVTGTALTTKPQVDLREVPVTGQPLIVTTQAVEARPVERIVEGFPTGEKIMELKIYRSTKKADLDNLISQAKANGVELKFEDIKYNDKGQLVNISGEIRKGDEKSHFNASDFAVVRLFLYKMGDRFSIQVIVNDKGEVS